MILYVHLCKHSKVERTLVKSREERERDLQGSSSMFSETLEVGVGLREIDLTLFVGPWTC